MPIQRRTATPTQSLRALVAGAAAPAHLPLQALAMHLLGLTQIAHGPQNTHVHACSLVSAPSDIFAGSSPVQLCASAVQGCCCGAWLDPGTTQQCSAAQSALALLCGSSTRVPRQFTLAPARHSSRSWVMPCRVSRCGVERQWAVDRLPGTNAMGPATRHAACDAPHRTPKPERQNRQPALHVWLACSTSGCPRRSPIRRRTFSAYSAQSRRSSSAWTQCEQHVLQIGSRKRPGAHDKVCKLAEQRFLYKRRCLQCWGQSAC